MTDHPPSLDNPFWDFAVATYDHDGVQALLLDWQESAGLNINIALFTLWLASKGFCVDSRHLPLIEQTAAPLDRNLVMPLRQLRRHAAEKARDYGDSAQTLKNKILVAELQAEKLVIASLFNLSQRLDASITSSERFCSTAIGTEPHLLAAHNLTLYLDQFPSLSADSVEQLLQRIEN